MDKKTNKKDVVQFYNFLQKLKERLTIILDVNPSSGVDPVDEDTSLINELYDLYDKTDMSWATKTQEKEHSVSQLTIESDKSSDK